MARLVVTTARPRANTAATSVATSSRRATAWACSLFRTIAAWFMSRMWSAVSLRPRKRGWSSRKYTSAASGGGPVAKAATRAW